MTDQQLLVVGRIRGTTDEAPKFTRSATVEELLWEIEQRLPVDKVFILQPHQDGKGYSFREAGLIVLDILRDGLQRQVTQPYVPPAQEITTTEGLVEELGGVTDIHRGEAPTPNPTSAAGFVFGQDPDLSIVPEKSQAELLAERGLEVENAPKAKRKKRAKAKPAPSITEKDLDGPLPHVVSRGGHRQVKSISTATQAEQMAASKQIFK